MDALTSRPTRIRVLTDSWFVNMFVLLLLLQQGVAIAQTGQIDACSIPDAQGNIIQLPELSEDVPINHVAGIFNFEGSGDQIVTSLYPNEYFRYDNDNRSLIVNKTLVADPTNSAIKLLIRCQMLTGQTAPFEYIVLVPIRDVNNHPPVFEKPVYTAAINEMTPVGSVVINGIVATDADPDNWVVIYEILEGPYSSYFSMPSESQGTITVARPLDFETMPNMTLEIIAKDTHNADLSSAGQLSSTSDVIITIIDADDQNPVFRNNNYVAYIEENAGVGSVVNMVPPISAYNPDSGFVTSLTYELLPDPIDEDNTYFNLDPNSAALTLAKDDLRRGRKFSLLVKASDSNNTDRYVTTLARVWVQAANENPPRFQEDVYTATLVTNSPPGTIVAIVTAIDNDFGSVITYSIDPPHESFTIGSRSGLVQTSSPLSVGSLTELQLTVVASDGIYDDTATILVTIVHTNENNPVFTQQFYAFSSQKETGYVIGQLLARDDDAGSLLTYSIISNSSVITIDARSGELVFRGDADDIKQSEYTLFVVANDNGNPSRQGTTVVTVTFDFKALPVVSEGDTDVVVIIVLAVLAGCLLLIIIILLIYIYRKNCSKHDPSQSFERGINVHDQKEYNAYVDDSDPEGLAYKLNARHLAVYNDVEVEEGFTTTQENPFYANNSSNSGSNSHMTYTYDLRPDLDAHTQAGESSTDPVYSTVLPKLQRTGGGLDYDTGIEPMHDGMSGAGSSMSTISSNSPHLYEGSISTFKRPTSNGTSHSDSTQRLVTPKGSMSKRGSSSTVSFIDDPTMQVYNPNAAVHGGISRPGKPGITVYY